jgi:hypothetical protein
MDMKPELDDIGEERAVPGTVGESGKGGAEEEARVVWNL